MDELNPFCLEEVMAHVRKQGVTDVRELEDVLLAHLGLVPTLVRPGRDASGELDQRLATRLNKRVDELILRMPARSAAVKHRVLHLVWQPWGTASRGDSIPALHPRLPALPMG